MNIETLFKLVSKQHFNFLTRFSLYKITFTYFIIMVRFAKTGLIKDSTAIPFCETFRVKVFFYPRETCFKCQTAAFCTISIPKKLSLERFESL